MDEIYRDLLPVCYLTKLPQSSIIVLHSSAGAAFQSNLVLFAYNAGVVELVDTLA